MASPQRLRDAARRPDPARIAAIALVCGAHVAGFLLLQAAMHVPEPAPDGHRLSVVALEFLPPEPPRSVPLSVMPARSPAAPVTVASPPPPRRPASTAVEIIDAAPRQTADPPRTESRDVFDPPAPHKPFPTEPRFSSNLPESRIRLPDRPSMLQSYWAVPEGENLKGRLVRKVPLVGMLLAATGGIGQPHCPPKSEHPDCLKRLVEGLSP